MADNKIQPNRGNSSEPAKGPEKKATISEKVVELSHEVYFLGVGRIKEAQSTPPSTGRLTDHQYTVASSGKTPKK